MTSYDPFATHPTPTAIGLFLLALIMVTLNLVAIIVFVKQQTRKPPVDYPLLGLLTANLLQGVLTLPSYALKKINALGSYEQGIICDIYRFSYFFCTHASIMCLLVSCFDRLIALVYSLRYWQIITKRRICVAVCATWVFVLAFDVLPFFISSGDNTEGCHYVPTKSWSVPMHIVMNIIPLPLLLGSYVVTIKIAYKHERKAKGTLKMSKLNRKERIRMVCGIRATKKVIMIIGSYFICVAPACIYYLMEWLCKSCFSQEYTRNHEQIVHFFIKVLVTVFAIVSAVIFFWNSKIFRKKVRELLSRRSATDSFRQSLSMTAVRRYIVSKTLMKKSKLDGNISGGSTPTDIDSRSLQSIEGSPRGVRGERNGNIDGLTFESVTDMKSAESPLIVQNGMKGNTENGMKGNTEREDSLKKQLFKRNLIANFVANKQETEEETLSDMDDELYCDPHCDLTERA